MSTFAPGIMVEFPMFRVVFRGGHYAHPLSGISCSSAYSDASSSDADVGSRLANCTIGSTMMRDVSLDIAPRGTSHGKSTYKVESRNIKCRVEFGRPHQGSKNSGPEKGRLAFK